MKTRFAFLPVLLLAVLLTAGCGSTPQQASYQATGITITSAEQAMGMWNDFVAEFHPPVATELQVKAAYEKYQAAMLEVIDANKLIVVLTAASPTNAPPAEASSKASTALQTASQALSDLFTLLRNLGVKL